MSLPHVRAGLRGPIALAVIVTLITAACSAGVATQAPSAAGPSAGGGSAAPSGGAAATPGATPASARPGGILVYTSVTQDLVDAMLQAFKAVSPSVPVTVFRAPTGELAGRIAAEQRTGRIQADVLWLTDPLSMGDYARQGALLPWMPTEAGAIDAAYRTDTSWGTRLLNMVIVRNTSVTPGPTTWKDLADPSYKDALAIPNPGFAGSAFAALGYFGLDAAFGMEYYRSLKSSGAVQVNSPDDIVTGVAQGRYKVGMTLEASANAAIRKGSPVAIVWPQPGAVAIYSPIAVVGATTNADGAKAFVNFVLSTGGQTVIASLGWQPIRPDVAGPKPGGAQVSPDWAAALAKRDQLLTDYRAIFGG